MWFEEELCCPTKCRMTALLLEYFTYKGLCFTRRLSVCLSASLFQCLLAPSRKTYWSNLYENFITHIDLGYLCTRKSPLHFGSIRSPVSGSGVRMWTGSLWRRSALLECSCLKSNVLTYAFWQAEGSALISRSILYVCRSSAYPHTGGAVTRFSHLFSAISRVLWWQVGVRPPLLQLFLGFTADDSLLAKSLEVSARLLHKQRSSRTVDKCETRYVLRRLQPDNRRIHDDVCYGPWNAARWHAKAIYGEQCRCRCWPTDAAHEFSTATDPTKYTFTSPSCALHREKSLFDVSLTLALATSAGTTQAMPLMPCVRPPMPVASWSNGVFISRVCIRA